MTQRVPGRERKGSRAADEERPEASHEAASETSDAAPVEDRHGLFWAEARRDFERLRADADAWQAERDELAAWDATIGDGLDAADGD